jgi:hypothetical protein
MDTNIVVGVMGRELWIQMRLKAVSYIKLCLWWLQNLRGHRNLSKQVYIYIDGDKKISVHVMITVQNTQKYVNP